MTNYLQVGHNVGRALTRLAPVMGTLVVISLYYGEYYAIPGTLLTMGIVFAVGWTLTRLCSAADDASKAEVFASAGAVWFVAALAGTLPFLTVAWTVALDPAVLPIPASATDPTLRAFRRPVNAWFESMSGLTGSGLTMARRESEFPHTLLWWRSLSQWLGGLGVIVFTVAIVNQSGNSMLTQFYESRSPLGQFQSGDRSNSPKLLVGVFAAVTLLSAALFWAVGMPAWAALNHAMTGLATGGFVVTDTSFKAYGPQVRAAALPIMFVGAIPLPAYYLLYKRNFSDLLTDSQIRWLAITICGGTALVLGNLATHTVYPSLSKSALRAVFQFVSANSGTGFYTVSSVGRKWPTISILLLTMAMALGGASGSTASGIKIIRGISISRGLRSRIRDPFPDETLSDSIDKSVSGQHSSENYGNAVTITILWAAVYLLGVFVLLVLLPIGPEGVPLRNVLFTVASAQGNVGLVSGIVTPSSLSKPAVAAGVKLMLTVNMWMGRLEIIPLLVFFRGVLNEVEPSGQSQSG
ncbi:TrkH family potassium uptake protein [Haloarcula nitratireducens]|uniref:TrkH family potassium uptake protein n=1 Tax=Haloarcula nitratireducens TaxID=2487749 RepID=A0AAW4PEZ1_9EURY|nr:potassium transporter TrkG [Halomicroarcula nitratireducens]MBX0296414.1 TrkH family potassium uptake protein [Halomicroarcula nitratireducens]